MRSLSFSRLGTIIALVYCTTGFAATGGSEVVLFTPWTFIQKKITSAFTSRSVNTQENIPAVDWQLDPWVPHLSGLNWNLKTKLDLVSFTPQAIQLKTKQLAFSITIQQLNLDQIIERNVDGAILRVRVQAQCGPITMTQPSAQMEARLGFQIQPTQVLTNIEMFNLTWAPGSWIVNDFACKGPEGFEQTIKVEIANDLKSAEKVRPWIQAIIAARAQAEANSLMTQLANPIPIPTDKSPLPLVMTFYSMQSAPEGILNTGKLVWSGRQGETNISHLVMNGVPASAAKSGLPVFISPTEGWSNMIYAQLQAKGDTYKTDMNQIKAFTDLLASPNQQSVVWPDLQNYSANSKFTLLVSRPRNYVLDWQTDGTAGVQSPVSAVIQSTRAGKLWNYIDLTGAVTGRLVPQLNAGSFNVAIKFSNSKFTGKFEPAYVQTFQPNTTLDARVLQAFSSYVNEGFKYSTSLPLLNLGFAGKATFNGWTGISKELVGIKMDLNP